MTGDRASTDSDEIWQPRDDFRNCRACGRAPKCCDHEPFRTGLSVDEINHVNRHLVSAAYVDTRTTMARQPESEIHSGSVDAVPVDREASYLPPIEHPYAPPKENTELTNVSRYRRLGMPKADALTADEYRIHPDMMRLPMKYRHFVLNLVAHASLLGNRHNSCQSCPPQRNPSSAATDVTAEPLRPRWCPDKEYPGTPQGCDPVDKPKPPIWVWKFDIERFQSVIFDRLSSQFPGAAFAFAVARSGVILPGKAKGFARNKDPYLEMTEDQPIMIASSSKLITGAAVLYALELAGNAINLGDYIWPYFPAFWVKNDNFKKIRFRDCLKYQCGIDSQAGGGQDYNITAIKDFVTKGAHGPTIIDPNKIGVDRQYNNVGWAWFRLALFYMMAPPDWISTLDNVVYPMSSSVWHAAIAVYYRNWVLANILPPGTNASTSPIGGTLYYPYPCPNPCINAPMPDHLLLAGGSGWFISAHDMIRFLSQLSRGEIVSASSTAKIFNFSNPGDTYLFYSYSTDTHGKILLKGGAIPNSKGMSYAFSNNVQAIVESNFDIKSATIDDIVLDAYHVSWIWTTL